MKKILFSILFLGGLLLPTSCNMNHEPIGSIIDENAMQTIEDCEHFRNACYVNIQALTTGGYVAYPEIQMDMFVGVVSNGNQMGAISTGNIISSDSDFEGVWAGLYNAIANCNFYFKYAPNVKIDKDDEATKLLYDRYWAEIQFTRAYYYYRLLDFFCPPYNESNKDKKYGLPIVTDYYPTAHKDVYPSRSTLTETYEFIEKDLSEAYTKLANYEEKSGDRSNLQPMAPYLSTYAIRALQARLALLKTDYKAAAEYANYIISKNIFPISARIAYKNMWDKDANNEIIFEPVSTATEPNVGSTGNYWNQNDEYTSWYIPVPELAELGEDKVYDDASDVRYETFVGKRDLRINGQIVKSPTFNKYPGNPELVNSMYVMLNKSKPFRISEMYLIVAEAEYEQNHPDAANEVLTTIRKNRYRNYTPKTYANEELRNQIRKERLRELIGEGFRMSDLRRWGIGFTRTVDNYVDYPGLAENTVVAGRGVTYQPNDYRYTWPIPSAEIQVNPHMTGQQNPGYAN